MEFVEEEDIRIMTCATCNLDYPEDEECRQCGYYDGRIESEEEEEEEEEGTEEINNLNKI